MDKTLLESLKGKSREERKEFFDAHKSDLLDGTLESVNGGTMADSGTGDNPDSEIPFDNNWFTSFGFVCNGEVVC